MQLHVCVLNFSVGGCRNPVEKQFCREVSNFQDTRRNPKSEKYHDTAHSRLLQKQVEGPVIEEASKDDDGMADDRASPTSWAAERKMCLSEQGRIVAPKSSSQALSTLITQCDSMSLPSSASAYLDIENSRFDSPPPSLSVSPQPAVNNKPNYKERTETLRYITPEDGIYLEVPQPSTSPTNLVSKAFSLHLIRVAV